MKRLPKPEMYTPKEAAERDISEVVKRAELCADYDAISLAEACKLYGEDAVMTKDIGAKIFTYGYLIDLFGADNPRFDEAIEILQGPVVQIPVKGYEEPVQDPSVLRHDGPVTAGRSREVGAVA
jgi:hypothetical protein